MVQKSHSEVSGTLPCPQGLPSSQGGRGEHAGEGAQGRVSFLPNLSRDCVWGLALQPRPHGVSGEAPQSSLPLSLLTGGRFPPGLTPSWGLGERTPAVLLEHRGPAPPCASGTSSPPQPTASPAEWRGPRPLAAALGAGGGLATWSLGTSEWRCRGRRAVTAAGRARTSASLPRRQGPARPPPPLPGLWPSFLPDSVSFVGAWIHEP